MFFRTYSYRNKWWLQFVTVILFKFWGFSSGVLTPWVCVCVCVGGGGGGGVYFREYREPGGLIQHKDDILSV